MSTIQVSTLELLFLYLKGETIKPPKNAIIVNLLGRTIGYKVLYSRLERVCNLEQAKVLDIIVISGAPRRVLRP